MASAVLSPPSPIPAIGGDDVARVEQWAARQRSELTRLALVMRSAQRRAEKAERAEREALPEVLLPEELRSVLHSIIDTAVREADVAVAAARLDAAAIVATEHERATDELRSLGLDPVVVLGSSAWTSDTIADIARPASVEELWQTVLTEAPAGHPRALVGPFTAVVDRPEVDLEVLFDDAELFEAFWGDETSRPPSREVVSASIARSPPEPTDEPTPAGLELPALVSGPMPRNGDDGELFDVFWRGNELFDGFWGDVEFGDVERRRPLRDLLRRRANQGP